VSKGDCFGWSSAIYGDYAVVGAPFKAQRMQGREFEEAGAVYIFKRVQGTGKWIEIQELQSQEGYPYNWFGGAVSICGPNIVVGANGDGNDSTSGIRKGAAYMYHLEPDGVWKLSQKLILPKRNERDNFGKAVALSENYAVVAAPGYTDGYMQGSGSSGMVAIYKLEKPGNWKSLGLLRTNEKGAKGFGESVSISEHEVVVSLETSSKTYIYGIRALGAIEMDTALMPNDTSDLGFGPSVSIHKNTLIIGYKGEFGPFDGLEIPNTDSVMPYLVQMPDGAFQSVNILNNKRIRDSAGISVSEFRSQAIPVESLKHRVARMAGAGTAYIYTKEKGRVWMLTQRITAEDRNYDDHFGMSVSVFDSMAVVGAFGTKSKGKAGQTGYYSGAAYVFKLNKQGVWKQTEKLVSNLGEPWTKFGFSVGASTNKLIVGSRFESSDSRNVNPVKNAGAAYIYEKK
jgi:hypothetical protein